MISSGDRLDGKYLVTRRLGGGGFGEVFLANDEAIPDRQVAIKVLTRVEDGDHSYLLWEMRALAKFNHPHIVAFYHHFRDANCLYLVMEFCSEGSLHEWLVDAGRFPVKRVFEWGVELSETLAFVHEKGIVHHDIKPMNILFAADWTMKLGDFGVANIKTGTPRYLPPEMLLGERVSRHDRRVDVYALGLTLLELITGHHPFENLKDDEAIQRRISHDFIPTDLPRWAQDILLKATHPTPELRFQTAEDFRDAIRARHVPHAFDGKRIKADALAKKAEAAIARRKWKTAEKLASYALDLSPDCVAALLAAGRCQLLIRRIDWAQEYFSKALLINPRTSVHKELGWIKLETGEVPTAISLLTDHLDRNASDYEALNLLLKCFYLTDRFDVAASLGQTLIEEKAPNDCFLNNLLLCRILDVGEDRDKLGALGARESTNPFVLYNRMVWKEEPAAWSSEGSPSLKSKLLFEEYRFGAANRAGRTNTLAVYLPDGTRREFVQPIVTVGSLRANDIALKDRNVSRRHCVIVNYPGDVWLYDLGGNAATEIDGQQFAGRIFLDGVHEVTIGRTIIRVGASRELLI